MSLKSFSEQLKTDLLRRCFLLANKGIGKVDPSPLVGALLALPDGKVLAEGYYQHYGAIHAEEMVLQQLSTIPENAVLFANLEPCSYRRQGLCCADLLISKKVKAVVYGCIDKNPLINGAGLAKLRQAGIIVEQSKLGQEAQDFNRVFFRHVATKKAYLAVKVAISLDGKIALANKQSKWISNEDSRHQAHKLRAYYQGLMVGNNTLTVDDPQLNVRHIAAARQPIKIVVSSSASIDFNSRFAQDVQARRIVISGSEVSAENKSKLEAHNISLLQTATLIPTFQQIKKILYNHNIVSILLEGGSKLLTSAFKEKEVDYLHISICPLLFGNDATPVIEELHLQHIANKPSWVLKKNQFWQNDLYAEYAFNDNHS